MSVFVNIIVQIMVAFITILIIYVATLNVLQIDRLITPLDTRVKRNESQIIINGYATPGQISKVSFNTINAYSDNYKKIPKSLDSRGGASYTYQFWLKINDTDNNKYKDLILLLKGDNRQYITGIYNEKGKLIEKKYPEYTIKSPLIKFGSSYNNIIVEFNTANVPNYKFDINMNNDETLPSRRNLLSLLPINWFMFTFVFEDNYNIIDEHENGIKSSFFINEIPYQINNASSDPLLKNNRLVQNDGYLYLLPNYQSDGDSFKIGNITYFNSAINHDQIKKNYNKGPPNKQYMIAQQKESKPSFITSYNKIDITNK